MRICLIATNGYFNDPRATTLAYSLRAAGHDVSVVATSPGAIADPERDGVVFVASRRPEGPGKVRSALRRIQPARLRSRLLTRALAREAAATQSVLFYPTSPDALEAAIRAAGDVGAVVRPPRFPSAGRRDLIDLAPRHPELSQPAAGSGLDLHGPVVRPGRPAPAAGRFAGKKILLAYRKTDINPGKYLEEALRFAGADVRLETEEVDWDSVDPDTTAVVFVEGPYPALEIRGRNPGVPVLFWVHHGEHHLAANLRLVDRYGADAVLLAHSWHLAHRFPVPVHRFPFGMATRLLDPSMPYEERPYDVAMVGAYVRGGGPYNRRGQLVEAVEATRPADRLAFASGVDSETMARLYGSAKVILNEGGTRHFPITMRVLEAIGSGALLVGDAIPGTEVLLDAGRHYVVLRDDLAGQLRELFSDEAAMAAIAAAGLAHACAHHTYDHRVDDLMAVIEATRPSARHERRGERSALAAAVDRDVEVQRVVQFGAPGLGSELPDREVWDGDAVADRLTPGSYDAVAIRHPDGGDLHEGALAARRYLYVEGPAEPVARFAARHWPEAEIIAGSGVTKVDLWAPAYRLPRGV